MERAALISILEKAAPGRILQLTRFGRSQVTAIWVEKSAIADVARALKSELKLDWLENFSVADMSTGSGNTGNALILTYFLRSTTTRETIVLRASVLLPGAEAWVEAPSVSSVWSMAPSFEKEASELFGIRFEGATPSAPQCPSGWTGFPLRKSYVFPHEVFGISHVRNRDTQESSSNDPFSH